MGLTRKKLPGLFTTAYVCLVLSCLHQVLTAEGQEARTWELALMLLVFPLNAALHFFDWAFPQLTGRGFVIFLTLALTALDALAIHLVCKNIFRED